MAKITVLGSGGFGMALALCSYNNGCEVSLWSPFKEEVELLREKRGNEKLLAGITLPDDINITDDISEVEGDTITIIATPSSAVREVAHKLSTCKDIGIVVNVAKGLEKNTLNRLSQVIKEELPSSPIVILSGPSHAEEVARKIPTSLVAASDSLYAAQAVQNILSSNVLRIYTSSDLTGVELGGALKNVIAIAAGICDGLKLGDNTKAALITRGLAEICRLGVCMGAHEATFSGLTGVGDLIVTCMSVHSRNNRFGNKVGSGMDIETALKETGTVEGYYATLMAYELAKKYNIEMPIISKCYDILYKNEDAKTALYDLMSRPGRSEY
ncbi:MAG: NAD(P)-dependent glycerol-3-phosphate dehydrogenase [Clostridia bacterium]|nr:NAD(P)-dependent glycerol-3-phosphate dehydrogenase [Clostridia bacterium]